jgi:membrane-bound lytic murein transglycosylase C
MIKNLLFVILLSNLLSAQSATDFQKQQMQDFEKEKTKFSAYKKSQEDEFDSYQKSQMKAFEDYKKEIGAYWQDPKMSTKKTWVAYTEDKKTRTDVDFEKETIVVETIAASPEEAKKKLQIALAKVVTIDTKTVQESDPLEKILSKIKKPQNVVTSKVKPEPILSTVVFDKEPTKDALISYVNKNANKSNITSIESNKIKNARVYTLHVSMPKDAMIKRSKIYYDEVKIQADKQSLPVPLVFAIMHSESSFNPRARSHVPAYGLMQIVPKSAGIDTYYYLYNEKKLVSSSYLYDSKNNITMGSGYLHVLYYKYLSKIKNPDSRLYCTIAAYNTGAGNIAWAFTRTNNMTKAAPIINTLSPEEVYNRLQKDLKYDEPKEYLKKVSQRMSAYNKIYGL